METQLVGRCSDVVLQGRPRTESNGSKFLECRQGLREYTIAEVVPVLDEVGVVRWSEGCAGPFLLETGAGYVGPVDGDLETGCGAVEAHPCVATLIILLAEAEYVWRIEVTNCGHVACLERISTDVSDLDGERRRRNSQIKRNGPSSWTGGEKDRWRLSVLQEKELLHFAQIFRPSRGSGKLNCLALECPGISALINPSWLPVKCYTQYVNA